jgi:hypothetical protein
MVIFHSCLYVDQRLIIGLPVSRGSRVDEGWPCRTSDFSLRPASPMAEWTVTPSSEPVGAAAVAAAGRCEVIASLAKRTVKICKETCLVDFAENLDGVSVLYLIVSHSPFFLAVCLVSPFFSFMTHC